MSSQTPPRGLLLFAHGARDAAWARPFEATAAQVLARSPGTPLQLAYLEFMAPDMAQAGAALAAQGCTQVTVLPLFLGAGGHVRRDVPALLSQLAQAHPQVQWRLADSVGAHPALVDALASIALEAL